MAYSYVQYPGNGSVTNFSFNFGYLSKTHVTAKVNSVAVPFTWLTGFSIQVTPAPAAGALVEVRRSTPLDQPAVDWVDGSTLTEADMDLDSIFNLYANQEARDFSESSVQLGSDGIWDGRGRGTTNFGAPTAPTSLVTKGYFDDVYTPALDAKVQAATTAAGQAGASAVMALRTLPVKSEVPPGNPLEGAEWLHASTGRKYTWYVDQDSAQWVEVDAALVVETPDTAGELRADLADAAKGSALVAYEGGTVRDALDNSKPFASPAAVRAYRGTATVSTMLADGGVLHKRSPKVGDRDDGVLRLIDADGNVWERPITGAVSVLWFGVGVGKGNAEVDTTAFQAALDWIAARSDTTTYPYYPRKLQIPKMERPYLLNRTLLAAFTLQIETDGAIIEAVPGFQARTIYGQTMNYMLVLKDNVPGRVRWGAVIPRNLIFLCNECVDSAVYIERMPYSYINCEVQGSVLDSVVVGPSNWGINLDNITIENFGGTGVAFLKDSAANGGSMNNPKIWGEFKEGVAGVRFDADAECNGFIISGGFIESVKYGVVRGAGAGLITVDGVDFEQCAFAVVRAIGRATGQQERMIVRGCFAHSSAQGGEKFFAGDMVLEVQQCRLYGETYDANTSGGGLVVFDGCTFPLNTVNPHPGANTLIEGTLTSNNRRKDPGTTQQVVRATNNFSYTNAESALSSTLSFIHSNGTGADRNSGVVLLYVNEMGAMGASPVQTGIAVDAYSSSFRPTVDNGISCGSESARFTEVRAVNGAINTSDGREKQQILPLHSAEKRVAVRLKGLVRTFKWNDAVAKKGEGARTHVGVIAQDVVAAFAAEGLDATRYGILCHDEWVGVPETCDEYGTVISQEIPKGDRYGIRYEELLAFIIAAL